MLGTGPKPGERRGASPPVENFSSPLEKCGRSLKISDIVQKIWAPLETLRPSWGPKLVTGLVGSWYLLTTAGGLFAFRLTARICPWHDLPSPHRKLSSLSAQGYVLEYHFSALQPADQNAFASSLSRPVLVTCAAYVGAVRSPAKVRQYHVTWLWWGRRPYTPGGPRR